MLKKFSNMQSSESACNDNNKKKRLNYWRNETEPEREMRKKISQSSSSLLLDMKTPCGICQIGLDFFFYILHSDQFLRFANIEVLSGSVKSQ